MNASAVVPNAATAKLMTPLARYTEHDARAQHRVGQTLHDPAQQELLADLPAVQGDHAVPQPGGPPRLGPRKTERASSSSASRSRGRAVEAHCALLHEHDSIGEARRDRERLLDHHHRLAVVTQGAEHVEQPLHDERRQTERQLVDQQELRLEQQRTPERHHLLLTAGERRRVLLPMRGEQRGTRRRRATMRVAASRRASGCRDQGRAQVLVDREPVEHVGAAHLHDAAPRTRLRADTRARLPPSSSIVPAVGVEQSADCSEQRRLARTVGAEDRDRFAGRDVEVEPEQHLHPAVPGFEPRDP